MRYINVQFMREFESRRDEEGVQKASKYSSWRANIGAACPRTLSISYFLHSAEWDPFTTDVLSASLNVCIN